MSAIKAALNEEATSSVTSALSAEPAPGGEHAEPTTDAPPHETHEVGS